MGAKRYFLAPVWVLETVFLAILDVVILAALILFCFKYDVSDPRSLFIFFGGWLGVTLGITGIAIVPAYRGLTIVKIDDKGLTNYLWPFHLKMLHFHWEDIIEVRFSRSRNYANDVKPIYVVLSNARITGSNFATTYNASTQMVIRVTEKNYKIVMVYLAKLKFISENSVDKMDFTELKNLADHGYKLLKNNADGF